MKTPNSYIIHETRTIVAIATGFARHSENPKTGNAIQTWFLRKSANPVEAVKTGRDQQVCFDCPLASGNGCYVQIKNAPLAIWKKYRAGGYARLIDLSLFKGRKVRFGSYGEPVLLPLPIVKAIAEASDGWLGYTHQWRNPLYQAYKAYLMASTSDRDDAEAIKAGWRTFLVSDVPQPDKVVCPASKEAGKRTTCENCGLCSGNLRKTARGIVPNQARSIVIRSHGSNAKRARASLQA